MSKPFLELKKSADRLYKLSKHKSKSTKEFAFMVRQSSVEIDRIEAHLNKIKKFVRNYRE